MLYEVITQMVATEYKEIGIFNLEKLAVIKIGKHFNFLAHSDHALDLTKNFVFNGPRCVPSLRLVPINGGTMHPAGIPPFEWIFPIGSYNFV